MSERENDGTQGLPKVCVGVRKPLDHVSSFFNVGSVKTCRSLGNVDD